MQEATEWISTKLGERRPDGCGTTPFNFGAFPDQGADPRIVFTFQKKICHLQSAVVYEQVKLGVDPENDLDFVDL